MFNRERWKIMLAYSGFGCLFTVIGMVLSPVTAVKDKFEDIECASLTVVDAEGNAWVSVCSGENDGRVTVIGKGKSSLVRSTAGLQD